MNLRVLVCLSLGSLAATPARAEIRFQHHYVSTTFPAHKGFGQAGVGDFDRNGKPDLLIGQHQGTKEKEQYLFLNNGRRGGWPHHLVTIGNTADGGVAALDVDGDGWLDVVSSGSWFRNGGAPTRAPFVKHVYDERAFGGHDMMIADVDGDGRKDVLVNTDKGLDKGLYWYRIPADPTTPWTRTRIGDEVHAGMWPGGVGDLDGDGDLDVVTHGWFENADGKGGSWRRRDTIGFGRAGRWGLSKQTALADLDRDGDLDVVQSESDLFEDAQVHWAENADGRGGRFISHALATSETPGDAAGDFHALAAADFDRDGDVDVFAAESEWNGKRARWFLWENVDGRGARMVRHLLLEGLGAHNAVTADVDGDGDLDILSKEFDPQPWNKLRGGRHADLLENRSRPSRSGGAGKRGSRPQTR